MRSRTLLRAGIILLGAIAPLMVDVRVQSVQAQSGSPAKPHFEVASIRAGCGAPAQSSDGKGPSKGGAANGASPGRLNDCTTLSNYIYLAYLRYPDGRLNSSSIAPRVKGGPSWVTSDRYRIVASAGSDASSEMMKGPMMQALLEDRFKLKVHRERRELAVYALRPVKGGIKAPRIRGCLAFDPAKPPPPPESVSKYCGRFGLGRKGQERVVDVDAMSMPEFAAQLSGWLDRPVIDRTTLPGRFGLHFEFAPDESTPSFAPTQSADTAGPSIFTALQEQLGLKLESSKGLGDVVVIDSIERPSEN